MQLFCEECFTYLGPKNLQICPQCGKEREIYNLFPEPGKLVWKEPFNLDGHPIGRPVYSNGLILVAWRSGKCAGGLSAVDRLGNLRWQINCNQVPMEGILLDYETLYFSTSGLMDGGTVYCCKVHTAKPGGEIVWQHNSQTIIKSKISGQPFLKENRLFVPCKNGSILCLDAVRGQAVPGWLGQVDQEVNWLLALNRSLIAINQEKGFIFQLDLLRGHQVGPTIGLNVRLSCEPLLWKKNLYLGSEDGRILKVDLHQQSVQDFAVGLKRIVAPPIVKDGLLIVGSQDHYIYAWSENGQKVWQSNFATEHAISSSPAARDDILVIGANDGKVYAADIESGENIWAFDTGLENAVARDVLYCDDTFYAGIYSRDEETGFLFALPWHLGEYEKIARKYAERGKNLEAASLFALASHYSIKNREALGDYATTCWGDAGQPRLAVQYWLGMAKPEKAALCWKFAAEDFRGKDNALAAEYYYQASRLYWRLGNTDSEDCCYHEAVDLGKWPRLRLKVINNPVQTVGKAGKLTIRVENIGYFRANNLHFDVGGSLLEPISFSMLASLDRDRHCDLSFVITPTRENDHVRVEVTYGGEGRDIPFNALLDIQIHAKKVTVIQLDGIVKSEVRIVNEDGGDMDIVAKDMVMSQLEIINKK